MSKILPGMLFLMLCACQRELHFPPATPEIEVIVPKEKTITAIVITNPLQTDYDSLVFRYGATSTREVHYPAHSDSAARTYFYDAAGRLSKLEDQKAIYYTNNNKARSIRFIYNAAGDLQQTITDFADGGIAGITAFISNPTNAAGLQMKVVDTAYRGAGYNLDWSNRIIYSSFSTSHHILYDSAIFVNTTTTGLFKTVVAAYTYNADSAVTSIDKRIYFNGSLSEYGTVQATPDPPALVYRALHTKLYRNLANWFDEGMVWQDDRFHLFPLSGGPYKSIFYRGFPAGPNPQVPPYQLDYTFMNSYASEQLSKSVISYALTGQGISNYTTVLRFYYKE